MHRKTQLRVATVFIAGIFKDTDQGHNHNEPRTKPLSRRQAEVYKCLTRLYIGVTGILVANGEL